MPTGKPIKWDKEELERLMDQGLCLKDIARLYNTFPLTVRQAMAKLGIERSCPLNRPADNGASEHEGEGDCSPT